MLKKITKIFAKSSPKIAHLSLSGVIGGGSKFEKGLNYENTFPLIEKAFEDKKIKAVAISINSPGGSPVQSELIYNAIRQKSEETGIPVFTFAKDVAACFIPQAWAMLPAPMPCRRRVRGAAAPAPAAREMSAPRRASCWHCSANQI